MDKELKELFYKSKEVLEDRIRNSSRNNELKELFFKRKETLKNRVYQCTSLIVPGVIVNLPFVEACATGRSSEQCISEYLQVFNISPLLYMTGLLMVDGVLALGITGYACVLGLQGATRGLEFVVRQGFRYILENQRRMEEKDEKKT